LWSPTDVPLIKHIPKSVRPACAAHLVSLLQAVVTQPQNNANWLALLSWGRTILQAPRRAGKRRNLSSTADKKTASPISPHCIIPHCQRSVVHAVTPQLYTYIHLFESGNLAHRHDRENKRNA